MKNDVGSISERRIAKALGASTTAASGATRGFKSDFELTARGDLGLRGECKATTLGSLSLKYEWLAKISQEAREKNQRPVLTVSFVHGSGEAKRFGDWVMMPLDVFNELAAED